MPAPSIPHIAITTSTDVEELRAATQGAVNSLVDRLNAALAPGDIDLQHNRVRNLAWPVSLRDGVNVEYLRAALKRLNRREEVDVEYADWWHTIEDYDPPGAGDPLSTITDGFTNPAVDVPPGFRLQLLEWVATLKTPPAGTGSVVCDILFSTNSGTSYTSIFSTSSYPTFDAGEVIVSGTSFDVPTIPRHALLRGDIRVVDGTAADLNLQLSGHKVPA